MKKPDFAQFAISPKTLLMEWPGRVAVPIETSKAGRVTTTAMEFAGAPAALDWCEANRAALVYLPPDRPGRN